MGGENLKIAQMGAQYYIDKALTDLDRALTFNKHQLPEFRNHCVTLVRSKSKEEAILVDGSAHMLEELFIKLFQKRPELRSVVQNALDKMYHYADTNL